jgi:hypothetical protein
MALSTYLMQQQRRKSGLLVKGEPGCDLVVLQQLAQKERPVDIRPIVHAGVPETLHGLVADGHQTRFVFLLVVFVVFLTRHECVDVSTFSIARAAGVDVVDGIDVVPVLDLVKVLSVVAVDSLISVEALIRLCPDV